MPPQKELDYLFHFPPSRTKYAEKLGSKAAAATAGRPRRAWIELFLQEWDLHRYPRLFDLTAGRFSADVSPNYSRMSTEEIRKAFTVVPKARIAIVLRDPVERVWSHARNTSKRWTVDDPAALIDRMTRFVHSKVCDLMSDYPRLVTDWRFHFGYENVLVSFYDDLDRNPRGFIDRILFFLGAPEFPLDRPEILTARSNVGAAIAMPENVRRSLEAHYEPMIARLRDLLATEGAPAWLVRA